MREPWFWRDDGLVARCLTAGLTPAGILYNRIQQAKIRRTRAYRSRLPVICVGNATLGGSGKTPLAIAIARLFAPTLGAIAFLSRGYGGQEQGPLLVDPANHHADTVGDEPLLLAAAGRTVIARDRVTGARLIEALTPQVNAIIMDDGFQNPTIEKDLSILILPSANARGNGGTFPAGPLREPLTTALARADLAIEIDSRHTADTGNSINPVETHTDRAVPVFRASVRTSAPPPSGPLIAFCGIARPERFFSLLEQSGGHVIEKVAFGDHHRFSSSELSVLKEKAQSAGATLITTEKDAARLGEAAHGFATAFKVEITLDAPDAFRAAAMDCLARRSRDSAISGLAS